MHTWVGLSNVAQSYDQWCCLRTFQMCIIACSTCVYLLHLKPFQWNTTFNCIERTGLFWQHWFQLFKGLVKATIYRFQLTESTNSCHLHTLPALSLWRKHACDLLFTSGHYVESFSKQNLIHHISVLSLHFFDTSHPKTNAAHRVTHQYSD